MQNGGSIPPSSPCHAQRHSRARSSRRFPPSDSDRSRVTQLDQWRVQLSFAAGSLPEPGVYGVPEQWPHVAALYREAGFVEGRTETVRSPQLSGWSTIPRRHRWTCGAPERSASTAPGSQRSPTIQRWGTSRSTPIGVRRDGTAVASIIDPLGRTAPFPRRCTGYMWCNLGCLACPTGPVRHR